MKTAIVTASALVAANRMDAGFHIIQSEHGGRAAELAAAMTAEEARSRIGQVPAHLLGFLAPLSRRGAKSLDRDGIDAIAKEYPHLSLALIEANGPAMAKRLADDAQDLQRRINDLGSLSARVASIATSALPPSGDHTLTGPRPGFAYPLRDLDRFDDELGEGYDHVALPAGEKEGTFVIRDMWPVKADASVHPGYDECPVPVAIADIDLTRPADLKMRHPGGRPFPGFERE